MPGGPLLPALATLGLALTVLAPMPSVADDFPPLFSFVITYDGPDNASSMAHLLEAPAGKHGFIREEHGRFVNDAGPVRLNATNLTGPANFPTREQADRLAARLARFGINCVRLHHMDTYWKWPGIIADDPATQRNFDPAQVERLDYMIAAFKRRGIYVDINLHVGRWWDERDGFTGKDKRPGFDKGLDNFEPRMIELQKEYARKLLAHVNPHTGLAYTDDPCVALVEINNENALFRGYIGGDIDRLPEPYAAEFRRQWNGWLREKHASTAAVLDAWKWTPTPLSDEQIPEGRFDGPIPAEGKRWTLALGSADATFKAEDGVLKVTVTRDGSEYFPKLFRDLVVRKDRPYTLSFKIRCGKGTPATALGMAVADTKGGWRSLGTHGLIKVGPDWQMCHHVFSAADDSDRAQFQLTRFKVGTYEVDDLSFQSGAESDFDADARLEDGTIPVIKVGAYAPPQAARDFCQFLMDTERKYWLGMSDFLKRELKVKSLISGTQLGYSPAHIQAQLDYIDAHSYWRHPSGADLLHDRYNWRIGNDPMVNSMACIRGLAASRVLGKPFTVSEYNHPFPNQYGAEGQPMLRAYGRLQGWDGVFQYTYNHHPDFEPSINPRYFDMIARTDVLAHLPACAAIFLRGDVQEAKSTAVAAIDYAGYFDRLVRAKAVGAAIGSAGLDERLTLLRKTAVDLSGEGGTDPASLPAISGDQKIFVSDTGELTWNVERAGAGYLTVNTPNTKLFTGFPEGRMIMLGGVTLDIGRTRLGWATISLVSRNATGFGESGKPANILVAATGVSENKGMTITTLAKDVITIRDKWGEGPVCVEGIPATINVPADSARVRCFALDPGGNRKKEISVERVGAGARIVLKPEYETVWYELDMR